MGTILQVKNYFFLSIDWSRENKKVNVFSYTAIVLIVIFCIKLYISNCTSICTSPANAINNNNTFMDAIIGVYNYF